MSETQTEKRLFTYAEAKALLPRVQQLTQEAHEKVERLLGLSEIGISLSGGWALEPEQSTAAIVSHHPQSVYFGMKSGFVPAEPKGDELIAGTDRGGVLPPEADVQGDGTIDSEADEPSMDTTPA